MFIIKNIVHLFALILLIFGCEENIEAENKSIEQNINENWNLIWSNEFEQDDIDNQKWNKLRWRPGWVNNEQQAYTDRDTNIFIRDGNLIVRALIEPGYVDND